MSGVFVAVVGPSGAGKDSVIAYARDRLGDAVMVVRRVVTRPASDGSEDHDSLSVEAFVAAEAEGRFALSWKAHGLHYGLPVTLEAELARGRVVVANLSRSVLPALETRYGENVVVVEVSARPDIVTARLAGRGRESAEDVEKRLARQAPTLPAGTIEIDNSGDLATAGEAFVRVLDSLAKTGAVA